jgi:hypothetical protein
MPPSASGSSSMRLAATPSMVVLVVVMRAVSGPTANAP